MLDTDPNSNGTQTHPASRKSGRTFATEDGTGMCHQFAESNCRNDVGRATVIIPSIPVRRFSHATGPR